MDPTGSTTEDSLRSRTRTDLEEKDTDRSRVDRGLGRMEHSEFRSVFLIIPISLRRTRRLRGIDFAFFSSLLFPAFLVF